MDEVFFALLTNVETGVVVLSSRALPLLFPVIDSLSAFSLFFVVLLVTLLTFHLAW
jgi:hypothetical protein